jgi:hypothetical protein
VEHTRLSGDVVNNCSVTTLMPEGMSSGDFKASDKNMLATVSTSKSSFEENIGKIKVESDYYPTDLNDNSDLDDLKETRDFLTTQLEVLLQENDELHEKLNVEHKIPSETQIEIKDLENEKIKLNRHCKHLESELEKQRLFWTVSAESSYRELRRLESENIDLNKQVGRLRQKIRMMESVGGHSSHLNLKTNSDVQEHDKRKEAVGFNRRYTRPRDMQSHGERSAEKESPSNVGGEKPVLSTKDGGPTGPCSVRVSEWSMNRHQVIEYTRQFEGLEFIDFQGDQASLVFSQSRYADEFRKRRVHSFGGSVIMVLASDDDYV